MEMRRSDLSQDAPALTDLVATLLGNVFKTLLKKSLHFDPVGKTKQSRSMVRTRAHMYALRCWHTRFN